MGYLKRFNVGGLVQKHKLEIFMETGTYKGWGIDVALKHPFKKIYSVEIYDKFYKKCLKKYKDESRVKLFHGNSIEGLKHFLRKDDRPALFWLDAHLPEHYDKDYGKEADRLRTPLHDELMAILRYHNAVKDVFIMDDMTLYKKGNYETVNWREDNGLDEGSLDFIHDCLGGTHHIETFEMDEGYAVCVPRKRKGK